MNYVSTRSIDPTPVSSALAIKSGLAEDGGLYMPTEIPSITMEELASYVPMSYSARAVRVLAKFLTDYTEEELTADIELAYDKTKFPGGVAPLHQISDMDVLELWHGPTSAFKDMALQIMPRLFVRALKKCNEEKTALILVATSGDTGKAALEGYRDVPGTQIQVYYPTDGVSQIQKLQMQTQEGANVRVLGIHGNFDDAQNGVKAIFSNQNTREKLGQNGYFLSSANSINWGRLVPQIVYYVSAYCDMVANGSITLGDAIDVCVPTGNFGNIFAAYLAKLAGVPIEKLVCASNQNNVLTDFLKTGTYDRNRAFLCSISPSMDILISSNLERLLYLTVGPARTAEHMKSLAEGGSYTLAPEDLAKIQKSFVGYYTDEETTRATVREVYEKEKYLIDTHTAVAVHAAKEYMSDYKAQRRVLTVSTASPYKFATDVLAALGDTAGADGYDALARLSDLTKTEIPAPLFSLKEKPLRHTGVIDRSEMEKSVDELIRA